MLRKPLGPIVFVALLTLAPPPSAAAQTTLTFFGGLNRASVSVDDVSVDLKSVTRMTIGMDAGFPMSDNLTMYLGAAYSQKGSSFSFFETAAITKVDYLDFKALAGVPASLGERSAVSFMAGPFVGMKISCSGELDGVSAECDGDTISTLDMGLTGGARLELGLSEKMGFSTGVFYNLGLKNAGTGNETTKTRALSLQAGLAFSLN